MFYRIILILFIFQEYFYSQTKIEWLTSNPTGKELFNLSVVDDSILCVVGNSGLFSRSEDYGKSWITIKIFPEPSPQIRRIVFFNKLEGVLLGERFEAENSEIYYTTDGGLSWNKSDFNYNVHLNDMLFTDKDNGIAVGYDEIYITGNKGKSWEQHKLIYGYKYNSIKKMANKNLIIAGGEFVSYGTRFQPPVVKGIILISTDKGSTWKRINEFNNEMVQYAYQIGENNFIASCLQLTNTSGSIKSIYKSTDSGLTWNKKNSEFNYHTITDIAFSSSTDGMISFSSGIYLTHDGGETWQIEYLDGSRVNSILHYSNNIIYSTGGAIRKSLDSGKTWTYLTPTLKPYGIIELIDEKNIYQISGSAVWKSTDSAKTWINKWNNPYIYNLCGSSFINSDYGYVINLTGEIYKTLNGGNSWQQQVYSPTIYLWNIKMYDSNNGVIVGNRKDLPDSQNGAALYTNDGGKNWNRATIQSALLYSVDYADQNIWFASSSEGTIYKSIDGGKIWDLNFKLGKSYLSQICFATKDIGYAGGSNGVLLKTINQGKHWELVNLNLSEDDYITGIKFYGELFGVIITSKGKMFTTVDGGINWIGESLNSQFNNVDIYKNTCYCSNPTIRFTKEGNFVDDKNSRNGTIPEQQVYPYRYCLNKISPILLTLLLQ